MASKLTKKDFDNLLDEVARDLTGILEKADSGDAVGESLEKADPGKETAAEKVPSGSSTSQKEESSSADDSGSSSAPPKSDSSPAPKTDDSPPASATPDAPPAPAADAASAAPPADAGSGDPAADTGLTVEQLQAEYAGLPVDQQKMHFLALKASLMQAIAAQGGVDGGMGGDASAMPPADASATLPASPAPPAAPMAKSEPVVDQSLLNRISSLEKSLKEKDDTIAGIGQLMDGLKTMFDQQNGRRLSIASLNTGIGKTGVELAKSETVDISNLSRAQVLDRLKEVAAKPELSKSDRGLINEYVAGPQKDIGKIVHLLKK